jgi:sugar phosphate isomerase/epimerase
MSKVRLFGAVVFVLLFLSGCGGGLFSGRSDVRRWRLGASSDSVRKLEKSDIAELKRYGFECTEVWSGSANTKEQKESLENKCERLAEWTEEAQIDIWSVHLPYGKDYDISEPDDAKRRENVSKIARAIEACRALEAEKFILHPGIGSKTDQERALRIAACRKSLPEAIAAAARYNAKITIECMPGTGVGNTSDEMLMLVDGIKEIEVCCDVNHLFQEKPEEFIDKVGGYITTLHLSDYDGRERHWLPGQGIINWNNVIGALQGCGYNGPFMFECKGTLEEKAQVWSKLRQDYLLAREREK